MSNCQNAFFSICIPSYNRAYTLNRCLDSLVNQTYKNFEVLFVDDGSTDETESVVRKYVDKLNLKYFKKENGGKHTALNVGIKTASDTELFMILDSDDWLKPDALEFFFNTWNDIDSTEQEKYCGVMAKSADQNEKILGNNFKDNQSSIDYVTFHFGGTYYGDCNECVKTSIIKQYEFPEPANTKFVPEYYIFDQIGVKYLLRCSNQVTQNKEYSLDGITKNANEFYKKNWIGCYYANVCRLEKVVPYAKDRISSRQVFWLWYVYWKDCYYDTENQLRRITHITFLGFLAKMRLIIKCISVFFKIEKEV